MNKGERLSAKAQAETAARLDQKAGRGRSYIRHGQHPNTRWGVWYDHAYSAAMRGDL